MSFLPEDDVEFLETKGWKYELISEEIVGGTRRNAIVFREFDINSNLFVAVDGSGERRKVTNCDLLIIVPQGYSTTKLDSWYTTPRLLREDGSDPTQTAFPQALFGSSWQFWSRHLEASDWRADVDGLETYMQFVNRGLGSS